jgi:hypothetical protein
MSLKIPSQKLVSILLPCMIGWVCTYLATDVFGNYAYGLFVWLPFVLGATSTLIYSYKNLVQRKQLRNNAFITLLVYCVGLLFFAWEGVICLIMAAPIGLLFTYFGFLLAYIFKRKKIGNNSPAAVILLFVSLPSLMSFEDHIGVAGDVRSITTSIEINASPETVWKKVIGFSPIKEPTEFIFKTGLAYPINATISGHGVGAIRHCNFSTGTFVEPITVWDEPNLLKFSVLEQPVPMKELSMYDIHPNHLHGYWVSQQGQFKLTQLPNGHTLLEGTTWYVNKIKPDLYWSAWSDYIVHAIHYRVLKHIKEDAEY